MATTCRTLIEAAWNSSAANDPDTLATKSELIGVIDRRLKQLYIIAARYNPFFFGTTSSVTGDGTKWARPTDAELVITAYGDGTAGGGGDAKLTGTPEVSIVPFNDQDSELSPKIYQLGRDYYSAGSASDPSASTDGDKIKFYYAKQPADLDPSLDWEHATNTLATDWPEQFNDLLVLHLAYYMALKDTVRDPNELQVLAQAEHGLLQVFQMHLEHENYAQRSRFWQQVRTPEPTARGTDVK
jgi:hypothetical protein